MKLISFGNEASSIGAAIAKTVMGSDLVRAPGTAMTAPHAMPEDPKPLSPWVPIGVAVGVFGFLGLLLHKMEKDTQALYLR